MASITFQHEDETTGIVTVFDIEAKVGKSYAATWDSPAEGGEIQYTSITLTDISVNQIPITISDDARSEIQDNFEATLNSPNKEARKLTERVEEMLHEAADNGPDPDEQRDRQRDQERHFPVTYPEHDDCPW